MTIGAWLKPQHQILCLVTIYTFLYSSFLSFTNTTFWIGCDFYIINYICILHSIICCITFTCFLAGTIYFFNTLILIFLKSFTFDLLVKWFLYTCLHLCLEIYWCPSWRKPKLLAEITEILPVEQECIVAAWACKYAQWSKGLVEVGDCLLYTSPSPRDA